MSRRDEIRSEEMMRELDELLDRVCEKRLDSSARI